MNQILMTIKFIQKVTHSVVISSFNKCIEWASENDIASQQVILLRGLHNKAIDKETPTKKQTAITDHFSLLDG